MLGKSKSNPAAKSDRAARGGGEREEENTHQHNKEGGNLGK